MRTLKFLSTALIFAVAVLAFAQEPTQWGFVRAIGAGNPGLTQFELLRNDERGGEVRFIVSPKDAACTSGATYLVSWSFVGDIRRITRGQKILVNLASKQLAGPRCGNSEPVVVTGQGNWDLVLDRSPLASTLKDYDVIATPAGYQEFYLHPEERGARHRPNPWTVVVGDNARRRTQILPVMISTSGASGGQAFVAALVFEAGAAGTPVGPGSSQTQPPSDSTMLGCFRDQGDPQGTGGRDLNGYAYNAPNMTGAVCRAECGRRGFAYAGTQYGSWCFCGNQYGKSGAASNCNMACAGNAQEICGGAWANNVFRTGTTAPPPPIAQPGMERQTDRPGSDYRSFDLSAADPGLCQAQCMQEGQCVAWTYVNPGVQGPQARCWLKSAVPAPVSSTCCVSGIKGGQPVAPVTPPITPPPQALNLTGRWSANDGGTYYLRQMGSELWWYGRSGDGGAAWSNVLHATIQGNRVTGRWADVPQGQAQSGGEMEITITSPDRLTATRRTGGFGGSEWTRQR